MSLLEKYSVSGFLVSLSWILSHVAVQNYSRGGKQSCPSMNGIRLRETEARSQPGVVQKL